MNLEQSLSALEEQAQQSRRNTIRAIVAFILLQSIGVILQMMQDFSPLASKIAIPIWSVLTLISMIAVGVTVGRYWYKHRPALERGRLDLQITMFGELQNQIAELKARLEK